MDGETSCKNVQNGFVDSSAVSISSCQDLIHNPPMNIGQPKIPPLEPIGQLLVLDTEQVLSPEIFFRDLPEARH